MPLSLNKILFNKIWFNNIVIVVIYFIWPVPSASAHHFLWRLLNVRSNSYCHNEDEDRDFHDHDCHHIHSKSEKVCGTAFSVKKYCGKSAGHFWAILGIFGSYLCHFGPFWVIFGPFRGIFGKNCGKFNFFAVPLGSRDLLLECMARIQYTCIHASIS